MIQRENIKQPIQSNLEPWEARYNGDNDLIPGAPVVTASDAAMLDMIRYLLYLVEDLQSEIDQLRGPVSASIRPAK